MNKERLIIDVYIVTHHSQRRVKSKVNMTMVMNKVLVGALLLTTLATASPV